MRIRSLFVSNYRNLNDCEVRPQLIHALTGCNGSGKSNFLHVIPFVAKLISGSDAQRKQLLAGWDWTPNRLDDPKTPSTAADAFKFRLDCEIVVNEVSWQVEYSLELTPRKYEQPEGQKGYISLPVSIASEVLTAKEIGKPGKSKTLVDRRSDGQTTLSYFDTRARPTFSAQGDLSILKIIEVREGNAFASEYPVIAAFKDALLATDLLRLSASKLLDNSTPLSGEAFQRTPGKVVDHFAPFNLLTAMQQTSTWEEYKRWMKLLCDVDDIFLHTIKQPDIDPSKGAPQYNVLMLRQHNQYLAPAQLSTGHAMIFGILTALFSFLRHNGAIFLEEPETYLHPRAIIDLLRALRETSERTTVLISTHSPVLLNDLKPEEVTLMKPAMVRGYFTTQPVSEIATAIEQIQRGYTSFGDMLQTNFTLDEAK